ncbi:MAG: hypothetical protein KatS3mg131_2251 [Candidatus Tectimicrobiota bacterium]|nr:MAG: hypothetical protein KatS3mg131_2251 [Candidatus Tectomicrobia bacterium]
MQRRLGLRQLPRRIECCDISTLGGTLAVGSLVCFTDGEPDKSRYRRYRVRTLAQPNDYGMMLEVLRRRFRRGLQEGDLPDLLLVDGGKGQLQVALRALAELGIADLEVAAIAKGRREGEVDRFYRPGRKNAISMPAHAPALHLLQHLRDEAHRFALAYHRRLRHRQLRHSLLDGIPGLGEKRKAQLLRHFGSLKGLQAASLDALTAVPGLPAPVARAVYAALHPGEVA